MQYNTFLSLLALLLSCVALFYSVWLNKKVRHSSSLTNNLNATLSVEKMLGKNPDLLRFHNINPEELEKTGSTSEELSYILMTFTIGGLYYKVCSPEDKSPFKDEYPSSYYYNLCKSEATQKLWPIVKKMMSESCYKEKIDNTINLLKSENSA